MTSFPDLSNLSSSAGINGVLSLPNSTYPFYWGIMMIAIGVIIALTQYFRDRTLTGRGNLLSSMAVASLATMILATIGSLFGIITMTILIPIIVGGTFIIAIWVFSS